MTYVYEKYCKPYNRKAFAIGCSMGANILGNLLGVQGKDSFLTAACVLQAPIKKWECQEGLRSSMWGFYDYVLGLSITEVVMKHEPILR